MKKFLTLLLISVLATPVFALDEVIFQPAERQTVNLLEKPKTLKGSLLIKDDQMLEELIKLQNDKDIEDIEKLWKATVENNKVIGFALKKLATPESQRRIHSSLMAKTLSAVVSGASFVPSAVGADPYIQTSAFAVGRLAQALLNKKSVPQEIPLTDTELIQLAGLVEDLQDNIVNSYYNYKAAILQLKDTRSRLILYNKNYNKALNSGDSLDISISSALYDDMVLEEYEYMQKAKKYHMQLQRLAGKKAVDNLNLYRYDFNNALFKGKGGAKS